MPRAFRTSVALRAVTLASMLATSGTAQVHVLGAAESLRATPDETTVLEVVAGAKLQLNADLANAVVLRFVDGAPMALRIDVREMIRTGNTNRNVVLGRGDVLFLPAGRAAGPDARSPIDLAIDAAEAVCGGESRGPLLCLRARHGGDDGERARAVRELCDLHAIGNCVLPTLRACLADEDLGVVREAVTALGVLGPRARAAAEQLRALCGHDDRQIRVRAKAALARVSER